MPPATVTQWRVAFLLDDAARGAEAAPEGTLQEAAAAAAGIGSPELPFELVRVLAERGAPAAALAVQQARGRTALSRCSEEDALEEALDEADTLMRIRLHCGRLTRAFTEARHPSPLRQDRAPSIQVRVCSCLRLCIRVPSACKVALWAAPDA